MLFSNLLSAAVAIPCLVAAIASQEEFDEGVLEHVYMKRDHVLDDRDVELAELHNVNTTEMFKHSIIKRSDGDDYTIWVSRSYIPVEGSGPSPAENDSGKKDSKVRKRQTAQRHKDDRLIYQDWPGIIVGKPDKCDTQTWYGHTTSTSAYTGGARAIQRWAEEVNAFWRFPAANNDDTHILLIGGSNSGANCKFAVKRLYQDRGRVIDYGTDDIRWQTQEALRRFSKQYNGSWRIDASGGGQCAKPGWANWYLTKTSLRV